MSLAGAVLKVLSENSKMPIPQGLTKMVSVHLKHIIKIWQQSSWFSYIKVYAKLFAFEKNDWKFEPSDHFKNVKLFLIKLNAVCKKSFIIISLPCKFASGAFCFVSVRHIKFSIALNKSSSYVFQFKIFQESSIIDSSSSINRFKTLKVVSNLSENTIHT